MAHRNCFETVDRTLQDIIQIEDPQNVEKPFGGKVVVLGGNGELGEGEGDYNISIPSDLIIQPSENPMQDIIDNIYPVLENKYIDPSYLRDRTILTPTNEVVEELNDYIVSSLNGEVHEYLSLDSICKASSNVPDQDLLYTVEFLNTLRFRGLPNHKLTLKIGLPVMLLRNMN
nr:uncharacterized protein LOC112002164 [Quercus suber]